MAKSLVLFAENALNVKIYVFHVF